MEVSANYTVLASRITNGFSLLRQDIQDSSKSVIRELNSVGNTVISEIVSVKDMIISLHDKMDILMSAQADTSILIRQVALDAKTILGEFKNSLNALQVSLSKSFEGLESMGPGSTEVRHWYVFYSQSVAPLSNAVIGIFFVRSFPLFTFTFSASFSLFIYFTILHYASPHCATSH